MAYLALVAGARVIMWWGQSMMDLTSTDDALWRSILDTAAQLDAQSGILACEDVAATAPGLPVLAKRCPEGVFLLGVNPTNQPLDTTISWPAKLCGVWDMEAAGAPVTLEPTGETRVRLGPHEVVRWSARPCP